jgi:cytochrome c oxidase subunit III
LEEKGIFKRREPFAFMLYLGLFGSCLLFSAVFFMFIKKEMVNQDIPIHLPWTIWLSTAFIIISSFTLIAASVLFKTQKFDWLRYFLLITLFCGLAFLYTQFQVWKGLFYTNQKLNNNTSASFIYILTGLHLVHILGGIVALFITISKIFRRGNYVDTFIYTVNPPNQLNIKLLSIYWHFLSILWIVIVLFLQYHAA